MEEKTKRLITCLEGGLFSEKKMAIARIELTTVKLVTITYRLFVPTF